MPKIVLGIIATKVKINANSHDDDFTPPFDPSCLPYVHTPAPLQGGCVIVVVLHVLLKCYRYACRVLCFEDRSYLNHIFHLKNLSIHAFV